MGFFAGYTTVFWRVLRDTKRKPTMLGAYPSFHYRARPTGHARRQAAAVRVARVLPGNLPNRDQHHHYVKYTYLGLDDSRASSKCQHTNNLKCPSVSSKYIYWGVDYSGALSKSEHTNTLRFGPLVWFVSNSSIHWWWAQHGFGTGTWPRRRPLRKTRTHL